MKALLGAIGAALVASLQAANATNATISIAPLGDFQLLAALSTEAPPSSLFPYNGGLGSMLPPRFMPAGTVGSKAVPTNNWWANMIAASTDVQVQPVWTNPYTARPSLAAAPFGLTLSYPYSTRAFGGSTGNGNANQYYLHAVINDFTFSAREFTAAPKFEVYAWDDLSASVRLFTTANNKIESTLVSGMAFATAKYLQLIPKFDTVHAILIVNGQNVQSGSVVSGSRFVVTLNNGQKWAIYTAVPLTLTMTGFSSLVGSASYTGYVRAALVVSDAQLAALDRTALCLLEGGDVEAKDTSAYSFNVKTSGDCSAGLFHYLQVHHIDTLDRTSAAEVSGVTAYSSTRGPMTGVITKTNPPVLRFTETTTAVADFYPPRRPTAAVVSAQKIKEALVADINAVWSIPANGSYYFNGKAAQKYANLCLMANDDVVSGSDKASLLRTCLNKLETVLVPFVTNS